MKTSLFKASEIQNFKVDEFKILAKWFSFIECWTFEENKTNQSWVGLHTHYFWCNTHWNFPKLSNFWRRAALNGAVLFSTLNAEIQCSMSTDKNMTAYFVASTLCMYSWRYCRDAYLILDGWLWKDISVREISS